MILLLVIVNIDVYFFSSLVNISGSVEYLFIGGKLNVWIVYFFLVFGFLNNRGICEVSKNLRI